MVGYIERYRQKTPGSERLFERAAKVMPGGICHNPRFFPPYPLYINRAEGPRIWDVDGNEYIDLWMGHFAHILGHKPKSTYGAIVDALEMGTHWGIVNELQVNFAEDLCRVIPSAELVRFGVSGAEATMYAVRLARAYTGRQTILKVKGGWHGANSDLSVAIHAPMDEPESAGLPSGVSEYTKTISFNDTEGTLKAIEEHSDDLAGIIMEAVGQYFVPPKPGYLEAVQDALKKVGAMFIMDEIIMGGRLALGGAQEYYGLSPDITTFGKVIGGGMNVGLVAGRKDIMSLAAPGAPKDRAVLMGGGTYSCMLPAMVAGRTMVKYLEENKDEIYPALAQKGDYVRAGIENAFKEHGIVAKCHGVGSLFTTSFPPDRDTAQLNCEDIEVNSDVALRDREFRLRMLNHGVYMIWGGGAVSMAHTQKELDAIISAVSAVAAEIAEDRNL